MNMNKQQVITSPHLKGRKKKVFDEDEDKIFFCLSCHTVWQRPSAVFKEVAYYKNLPSLGRVRRICPSCGG